MEASKKDHQHFIIFKPYGYLSQFASNDSKQQSKKFLGSLHDFPDGIMPIGRLDEQSEGLLLLTTALRLVRVRVGPIHIGHMQAGDVVEVKSNSL